MLIVAVDTDDSAVQFLRAELTAAYPGSVIECYTDPMLALKYCRDHPPDLSVAGYDLRRIDGITYLKLLRRLVPGAAVVLLDEGDYSLREARNLMMPYISRPITAEKIRRTEDDYGGRKENGRRMTEDG